MSAVKARVRLRGTKTGYSSDAVLADSGARMSLIDSSIAERIGVEYTGREINFVSISGHTVKALEAVVVELEVESEILKYEAIAVGVLTLERANMIPDTTTGKLKKVESFIV